MEIKGNSQVQGTPVENRLDTRITEVNKKENKFRQVFIINKQPEALRNAYFEIHAQPENRPINLENTKIVSLVKVGSGSTPDNLNSPAAAVEYDTEVVAKNNQQRIKITPKGIPDRANQALALTIESTLGNSGSIGTGIDFVNYDDSNTYWMAESYNSFNDIQLDPIDSTRSRSANLEAPAETEKSNSRLIVESRNTLKAYRAVSYADQLASQDPLDAARKNLEYDKDKNKDFYVNNILENILPASLNTRLEFGDELVGQPVGAGNGWEVVDPQRSRNKTTRSDGPNNQTRITEINKSEGKYRQIFLVNKSGETLSDAKFDFHAEPKTSNVYGKNQGLEI